MRDFEFGGVFRGPGLPIADIAGLAGMMGCRFSGPEMADFAGLKGL
jgi:hypothetical protein